MSAATSGLAPVRQPIRAAAPALTVEPYPFKLRDGTVIQAERGSFEVPERRGNAKSRRIRIGFVRFRSTAAHPGAPIVYLAGGPGGSGIDAARGARQPIFLALRALGDVIALDQRGVGISNSIPPCKAATSLDPAGGLSEQAFTRYYRDTLTTCVGKWRAAGVAVEGYTTPENADDVEDLRRAIGAPKLRLWAISYGTHLAFEMMRRHPGSVDRVVMASVEGMDQTVKLPARVDAALGRLANSAGAAEGAALLATMRRVHARLDARPQVMTLGDATGTIRFAMNAFPLRMLIGNIAKNPAGMTQLAQLYAAFDAGQGEAVAPLLYAAFLKDPLTMSGMPELMDLSSGVSPSRLAIIGREAPAAIVGTATNFPMPQVAGTVPGMDLGKDFRTDIRSAIPTLVVSGDLDLRTPIEEQTTATAGLSRLTRVTVHGGGHDLFEAHPAISGMIAAFFTGRPIKETSVVVPVPKN
ncbi:hypothetical protein ASE86_14195 [Sphingomonas sp. Leaf33]|uniref:alpha/beta hydrolase n=1 Tax=Sphingomonas sp. Leaf33 TaxID=1736215 RepID=UPI0006FFA187|nr:alpha/beta hydrolase [Sphingomonas sp. Leaf33]KQN22924.1 hypothetical protein ASE86_14195 [Sphingomonas sp. Leaf33]